MCVKFGLAVAAMFLLHVAKCEYIPPGPAYQCPTNKAVTYPCVCEKPGDKGITVVCENTNLASLSVGVNNIASENLLIEELVISKCKIRRLYGSLFHKSKIRTLKIKDTPLKIIEPYTFFRVNKTLQDLQIINTELDEFPREAFEVLGNVSLLRLEGHRIQKLEPNAFASSLLRNSLERLHITKGNITEIPLDVFTPLKRLKTLDLHGNQIKELKKNQFKGLRDVELLDLSFNNLTKLDSSHLADLTKLGWCNVSNNALNELTRGTFARNTVLKYLNFNHNKVKRLDSNSFRGMRFIRRLLFSDNEISNVGRGTFNSVTRIGTIDLARNQLKKIDFQMFFQLNYVEKIDVSENMVTEIQKLAFKDLYLVHINLSHNAINKIEQGAFENCANITYLDMSHNQISEIPAKAFDSTTYATHLEISFNNLTSLSQVPLQNMTGIKVLNVSHNHLKSIPKNTFPKLYELHTIDVSHNQIRDIFNGVFQVLLSLRSLNLSHNRLETVKGSVFGTLPTLLELNLDNNGLKDMSRGALTRLSSLRHLTVRNNNMSKIFQIPISLSELHFSNNSLETVSSTGDVWPTMNSLIKLDLSRNMLQDNLKKGSFAGLLTLQELVLNYNGITTSPWESLSDLTSLQYLELEGNNITQLSRSAFGRLPIVFRLNLAENQVRNISERAFDGLLQLLTLNLSRNHLSHIPNGAFQGLVSLRSLDLSHNKLEKLDNKTNGLLEDCLSLETLNLSDNKISFVTRKMFPSSPYIPYRLKSIDLSYNSMPVLTYDITVGTSKVEFLNISHNMINEVRRGVLGNLTAVKVLDLSYNQLTEFPDHYFGPPKNLTEVYLSHNKFHKLPLEELESLKGKITVIDVQNNYLAGFPTQFLSLLENGTLFKYSGNRLDCNCFIRPLRRWMEKQLDLPFDYKNITCFGPGNLEGRSLFQVHEQELTCLQTFHYTDEKFDVTPDVKFRSLQLSSYGELSIQWLVISKEDIADFYLVIRDVKTSSIIYEKLIAYNERKQVINMGEITDYLRKSKQTLPKETFAGVRTVQVCLINIDSEGNIGEDYNNQCNLVDNFHLTWSGSCNTLANPIFTLFLLSFRFLINYTI